MVQAWHQRRTAAVLDNPAAAVHPHATLNLMPLIPVLTDAPADAERAAGIDVDHPESRQARYAYRDQGHPNALKHEFTARDPTIRS